jgi:hypothetical protein
MQKTILFIFFLILSSWQGTAADTAPEVRTPLQFMVGRWAGTTHGEPSSGKVERIYQFALKGNFLQVENKSSYPPQSSNPNGKIQKMSGS